METNNYQRPGAISNAHAGREFENAARLFFEKTGIVLYPDFSIPIGHAQKKHHRFDLGSDDPPILVECKSYTWTISGKSPSAKLRAMNEAMLHFSVAPHHYRKIMFVLRHMRGELSLASHYIKTQGHLIGSGIEIWEFDLDSEDGRKFFPDFNT